MQNKTFYFQQYFILRILEDCPQLIILMVYVVVLYEPKGYFCVEMVHDQWMRNSGDWSDTNINSLLAKADLSKSTTSLFFDTNNTDVTLSTFVSVFSILFFSFLGLNKALKMREAISRQKYFLMTVPF